MGRESARALDTSFQHGFAEAGNDVETHRTETVAPESEDLARAACPRCKSRDVRRSRARGPIDLMMSAFGYRPHRCRWCRTRYFARD